MITKKMEVKMPRPKLYNGWLPAVYMSKTDESKIRELATQKNLRLADLQRKIYQLVISNPALLDNRKDGESES